MRECSTKSFTFYGIQMFNFVFTRIHNFRQLNPIQNLTVCMIYFNITVPFKPLKFRFFDYNHGRIFNFSYTCYIPRRLSFLALISIIKYGEEYKLRGVSLCSLLHPLDQWYSTFFVRVPPDIIYLLLCTPKVGV
jgi:hypothetical protein